MKITSEIELRNIYGHAKGRSKLKQLECLEKHSTNFIETSPFLVLSTANSEGKLDSSPRGGEAGFVKVLNEKTLLIPDSKGNNRLDSLVNLISNTNVGCLFLIPGVDETLRINGKAELRTDDELLDYFSKERNTPKIVIKVDIEEIFLHCAKALMRSKLWSKESAIDRSEFPTMSQMINDQLNDQSEPESHEAMVERYKKDL